MNLPELETAGSKPTRNEIRAQLKRMLASPVFSSADRLSRLLTYLVERASINAVGDLKEYTVGLEVFSRPPDFDPRTDSVVRVHGSRLRAKLDEYYRTEGELDPILITLPKGTYVVKFSYLAERTSKLVAMPSPSVPQPEPPPIPEPEPGPEIPVAAPVPAVPELGEKRRAISRRATVIAGSIALALAFGLAAVRWFLAPPAPLPVLVSPLTTLPGDERHPSFSPDGSQVVFTWAGENQDNEDLYLIGRGGGAVRRLTTDPATDRFPAWSPDGRLIAFIRGGRDVLAISPLGGPERKITESGSGFFVSWTPDSQAVLVTGREPGRTKFDLYLVPLDGGSKRRLTAPEDDLNPAQPFIISPDGRWLGFEQQPYPEARSELYVRDMSGGKAHRLTHDLRWISGWTWTPDSHAILYSSNRTGSFGLWRVPVSSLSLKPRPIPEAGEECRYPVMALRAEKTILACEQRMFDVNLHDMALEADGVTPRETRPILVSTRVESSPQFSPDGRSIAFVSNRSGYQEIWKSDADGKNAQVLTAFVRTGDGPGSPRWSPDSRRIVFDVLEPVHRQLYMVNADGSGIRRLTSWPSEQFRPSWSRDGKWIYFGCTRSGRPEIWKAPVTQSGELNPNEARQLTRDIGFEAFDSADGGLVYFATPSPRHMLRSVPASGGASSTVIAGGISHGWWALARGGVYFADIENTPATIYFEDLATHRRTRIGSIDDPVFAANPDFCVSGDGRRLLYGQIELSNTDLKLLENVR